MSRALNNIVLSHAKNHQEKVTQMFIFYLVLLSVEMMFISYLNVRRPVEMSNILAVACSNGLKEQRP